MSAEKITAATVLRALRARHSKDIFVPECNLGSAWSGCRRIDAWAMPKSWAPLTTIGYEVKVSRSDFMRDNKWHEYAKFVHELWFACPWGLIDKEELPAGIGLLWLNKGGKMVRKRKAVRSVGQDEHITMVMAYVLMSRAQIVTSRAGLASPPTAEDWADYYEERAIHRDIGQKVSEYIAQRIGKVEAENMELRDRASGIDEIRSKLKEVGLDPDRLNHWNLESQVGDLRGIVPHRKVNEVRRLGESLVEMARDLESLRTKGD